MNTTEFTTAILNHKTGFLISTGDTDGDRNAAFEMSSLYFDSAEIAEPNTMHFFNKHNVAEVNGKEVISIYGLGRTFIPIPAIHSIKEYLDDSHYYAFNVEVQRLFEVEIVNEVSDINSVYTIGLM